MLWRLSLCVVLTVAVLAACERDSDSITGIDEVEGTLDHHPERQSCHFEPEAITTIEGDDEVVLIEFSYAGGEIWDPSGIGCNLVHPDSVTGAPLASHGVSYTDSVGGDGDFLALAQCEYSGGFCAYNVPSPVNALWIDHVVGPSSFSGYMRFDPPISEISFMVCSDQSHGLTAWDSLGNTIVPETVGPTTASPCAPEDWVPFGIESPSGDYNISRVRLRRDGGYTWWDDMTFRREAQPALECTSVKRGQTATCTILEQVDSVIAWHFVGNIPLVGSFPFDTVMSSTNWAGRVALTGLVSVDVFINDSIHTFQDSLVVEPRSLSSPQWSWDDSKWSYDPAQGKPCLPGYGPWYFPDPPPLAENSSVEDCSIQTFTPRSNEISVFDSTFSADSVFDGGPNHGLFFVAEAFYEMKHGSYYNPSITPDTAGSSVTSTANLKDCKAQRNVTSLSKNLHEFNLDCTKPPEQNEFLAWWDAVEAHEGYGTPGSGPDNNGHQAQREIAAAIPDYDPYSIAEPMVGTSMSQLTDLLATPVFTADDAIADSSKSHVAVQGNWGTYDSATGKWCGNIYTYWTDSIPAEYVRAKVCEKND